MSKSPQKTALLLIFLTVFIDLLGFGIVLPLVPIYAKQIAIDHQLSERQVTTALVVIMTSFSAMQLIFAPVWGRLSDRIGRRPILLLGLAGSTCFYGMFGLAMQWRSLFGMFVSRFGAGITCATISTAQAYIADVTERQHRARGMALIGAAFGLGFTFGPLLGAMALAGSADAATSAWPGFVASLLSGTAFLLALIRLPESLPRDKIPEARRHFDLASLREALATPSMPSLLLTTFLCVFALANFESTLSLTTEAVLQHQQQSAEPIAAPSAAAHANAEQQPEAKLSNSEARGIFYIFAYMGLVQSLVQGGLVRRIARRASELTLAWIGGALSVGGFVMLATLSRHGLAWHMASVTVEISGIAFMMPAVTSLISRRCDPSKQGGMLGLSDSVNTMARIAGMTWGVTLFRRLFTLPFWTAAVVMIVATLLVTVAVRSGHDYQDEIVPQPVPET
jgi:MFS transporter, DHA1 family, tetracycline resistance protein